jgi:Glycosyl transferase 4-like domain
MRLLAPRLSEHGWEPTVVSADPRDLAGSKEPELERFVHGPVRVERVRALGGASGRFLGIGDLGLRTLSSLYRRCRDLLRAESYDAILITLPPHYTALLGPWLHRASGVPYVLDYQDPWVSAWGVTVGGGTGGRPDWKSRVSHRIAQLLEPYSVRKAAGLTAVSHGTLEGLFERRPGLRRLPRAEVPLGGEPLDFACARRSPRPNRFFDPGDGLLHIGYVGTVLPVGGRAVLQGFFAGLALLLERRPELRAKLRLHFVGTSMLSSGAPAPLVLPLAQQAGVGDCVEEHPLRIDYLDTLTVLTQAGAVLLLGGTERHYTASRVYPALLSGTPLLAVYREESTVCDVLRQQGPKETTHLVTFSASEGPQSVREAVAQALDALARAESSRKGDPAPELGAWTASALAAAMAGCLNHAVMHESSSSSAHV